VFENRTLRRIFGQKKDEVTVNWREVNNQKLHNLYSSPSTVQKRKLACRTLYNQNGPVKEDKKGRVCSANGGEEEFIEVIGVDA
jgi:hypothetical protein